MRNLSTPFLLTLAPSACPVALQGSHSHLLYILLGKTPRNATGHGKGGGEYPTKLRRDKTVQSDTFNPLPLLIADEIGGVPAGRGG